LILVVYIETTRKKESKAPGDLIVLSLSLRIVSERREKTGKATDHEKKAGLSGTRKKEE